MALPALVIPAIIGIVDKIFDRVIPDKVAADKAKAEFLMTAQAQDFQLMLAQVQTNMEEAKNTNWFVAGWRPAIGWICGAALGYTYIILPFLQFGIFAWGSAEMVSQFSKLPKLNLDDLLPILLGMLGLAGFRTIEKVKTAS